MSNIDIKYNYKVSDVSLIDECYDKYKLSNILDQLRNKPSGDGSNVIEYVESVNGLTGNLIISGTGTVEVVKSGSTITIAGLGQSQGQSSGVKSLNALSNDITLKAGAGISVEKNTNNNSITISYSGINPDSIQRVKSLNALSNDITLTGGNGISIDKNGNTLCISYTGTDPNSVQRVTSLNNLSNAVNLSGGNGIGIDKNGNTLCISYTGTDPNSVARVTSLNNISGNVTLTSGDDIAIQQSDSRLSISYTGINVRSLCGLTGDVNISCVGGIAASIDANRNQLVLTCTASGGTDIPTTTNITYSELFDLVTGSQLIPGMKYRITDYVAITNKDVGPFSTSKSTEKARTKQLRKRPPLKAGQGDTHWFNVREDIFYKSANHPFDIIVTALTEYSLDENAKAAFNETWMKEYSEDELENPDSLYWTDPRWHFVENRLEAWELKYSIFNDTSRFAWANEEHGKGVVYWLKDEYGNEAPYDFKGILFSKLNFAETLESGNLQYKDTTFAEYDQQECKYYTFSTEYLDDSQYDSTGEINTIVLDDTVNKTHQLAPVCPTAEFVEEVLEQTPTMNKIKPYILDGKQYLNGIVFIMKNVKFIQIK